MDRFVCPLCGFRDRSPWLLVPLKVCCPDCHVWFGFSPVMGGPVRCVPQPHRRAPGAKLGAFGDTVTLAAAMQDGPLGDAAPCDVPDAERCAYVCPDGLRCYGRVHDDGIRHYTVHLHPVRPDGGAGD